ncbi:MAG: hypothetical protein KKG00_08520 [Bacteroidetes bacterium]|nr:hypothetical protein [Bacteroidota bacterium]
MKSEAVRDSEYFEWEKKYLEAEREIEKHNKIYGGALIALSLSIYSFMVWHGKASEGFNILITAIVTNSFGGIFKSVSGKKMN